MSKVLDYFKTDFLQDYLNAARDFVNFCKNSISKVTERDLQYADTSYGITELISCPLKAFYRKQLGEEVQIDKLEVADGFIFETIVKALFIERFGEQAVEPEKLLDYQIDVTNLLQKHNILTDKTFFERYRRIYRLAQNGERYYFHLNGHLDVFVQPDSNTVVGIELKDTVLMFDNYTFAAPDSIIILESVNDLKRININFKYILQARIQKYLLEKLYPDKKVEQYLVLKTNLRTKFKLGKSIIVFPIEQSLSDEEFLQLVENFLTNLKPKAEWECKICPYNIELKCCSYATQNASLKEEEYLQFKLQEMIQEIDANRCEDTKQLDIVKDILQLEEKLNNESIEHLLEFYAKLQSLLKNIEEQLKKRINGQYKLKNGKVVGWQDVTSYEYDIVTLASLALQKNISLQNLLKDGIFKIDGRAANKKLPKYFSAEEINQIKKRVCKKRFKL